MIKTSVRGFNYAKYSYVIRMNSYNEEFVRPSALNGNMTNSKKKKKPVTPAPS